MNINRNNYEAFFIDYLEGKLDTKMVDDFIEFLQQNPDLKEELSLFEAVSVTGEEITFNKKDSLFKEKYDIEDEFNNAAIAGLEGDISASEKIKFEKYLSAHPEKQKDAALFNHTKLQPDLTVTFNQKNKIYRKPVGKTILLWSVRVAAVVVIALSVFLFVNKSSDKITIENQVAEVQEETENNKQATVEKNVHPEIVNEVNNVIKTTTVNSKNPEYPTSKKNVQDIPDPQVNEELAEVVKKEAAPNELKSIAPEFYAGIPKAELAPVKQIVVLSNEPEEEKLLVDVVREKTGIEKLSLNKITKAGLSLVATLSGDKFNYDTNAEGKVTEIKYDSRILAFSIPTKNESDDK